MFFSFRSGNIFYMVGQAYVVVLFVRALFSWFPESPSSPLNPLRRLVIVITEPVLAPFRRIIPPVGMFDISFLVAFVVVEVIVQGLLARL